MDQETRIVEKILRKADYYKEKYGDYIEVLEASPMSKIVGFTEFDVYALGEQLETFENYKRFAEDNGIANELGTLPQIALDVIAASYATSIVPMVASVQPM